MAPHRTHDFPADAWFCTRCGDRKDRAELRCVADGPIYQDDPAAVAEMETEKNG